MAAEFKSHVLRRDEKGLLGIPFKRWLLSGVVGGLVFALGGVVLGGGGIPAAFLVGLTVLILTGERYGMPRWQRWILAGRGALLVRAARHPDGLAAKLVASLDIPTAAITVVDGDQLFAPPVMASTGDLAEWVSRLDPQAAEDDLVVVAQPLPPPVPHHEDVP